MSIYFDIRQIMWFAVVEDIDWVIIFLSDKKYKDFIWKLEVLVSNNNLIDIDEKNVSTLINILGSRLNL